MPTRQIGPVGVPASFQPHKSTPRVLPGSVSRPRRHHGRPLPESGGSDPPRDSPVCGTAPWPDPAWPGGSIPLPALHGIRAGERQARVRRLPDSRAVGDERSALPGGRVSGPGQRTGRGGGDVVLMCVHPTPRADGKVQVLLGAHSLSQPEPSKRLYDVLRAVPHPGSRPETIDHDLLLLQLSEKAVLGPAVKLLPWQREDRDVAAGTLCDVAGWGVVSHTGRKPDRLQHLLLPVLDRATCNLRTYHDGTITERMMCAESNRRDTCKGDSGGPLVCGSVAEGVVTSGSRVCGNRKKPGIYTRLASYVAWIDGVMAEGATA